MARGEFGNIAEAIGECWARVPYSMETDTVFREMLDKLSTSFKKQRPGFDRALFLAAVTDHYLAKRQPYKKKRAGQ